MEKKGREVEIAITEKKHKNVKNSLKQQPDNMYVKFEEQFGQDRHDYMFC